MNTNGNKKVRRVMVVPGIYLMLEDDKKILTYDSPGPRRLSIAAVISFVTILSWPIWILGPVMLPLRGVGTLGDTRLIGLGGLFLAPSLSFGFGICGFMEIYRSRGRLRGTRLL